MSFNLSELDAILNAGVGTEYISIVREIKDLEKEYKRIREARKKEYMNAPKSLWIFPHFLYNENNYPYSIFNKLAAKQRYYINEDEAYICTSEFSLPVSAKTTIENIEITSSAAIRCEEWEAVRKKLAKENGLTINEDSFYTKTDSLENLMERVFSVRKAGIWLKNSKEKEVERVFAWGYVPDESLKPAVK